MERLLRLFDEAKKYVEFIEHEMGINAQFISVGPEREKTLIKTK
ncbi:MAG: adenylosuccinate synthetase [Minisyncoccia bacterium]